MTQSDAKRGTWPSGPQRSFIYEGALWRVQEFPPASYDRRSSPRLVFESEAAVRAVRNYPSDWHELMREELMALSWSK